MRASVMAALIMGAPALACAAPVKVAPDAPYGVTVETFATSKAQGKKGLMWEGFSAGGYDYYSQLTATGKAGGFMLGKMKYKVTVNYRFTKADQTPLLSGACQIGSEKQDSVFGFVSKTTTGGLYTCTFQNMGQDQAKTDYALEVVLPPAGETNVNGGTSSASISIRVSPKDPNLYGGTRALMTYKGVTYDALPTSYDGSRTISRIVDGFVISRYGKPVGRVDFDGNNRDKAKITAPVAEADGREAVVFFAAQLLAMPDINAGYVRSVLHLD